MRVITRCLLTLALLCAAFVPAPGWVVAAPAAADGVVGNGDPSSCTDAELTLELSVSGPVTFACGASPHTLFITTANGIAVSTGTHTLIGGGLITLSGNNVANRRIFNVTGSAVLTLTKLSLANGQMLTANGGLVLNQAKLVLDGVEVYNGQAGPGRLGGAIFNDGGQLVVTNAIFHNNSSTGGGAIYNQVGGNASISQSQFYDNTVVQNFYGGAIVNAGLMTVTTSRFTGNVLSVTSACPNCGGGAIANFASGTVTISDALFSDNRSESQGGAVWSQGHLGLQNATLYNNFAKVQGGALANTGSGQAAITHTVFSGNQSSTGGGGALLNNVATLRLLDVNLLNNTGYSGGALYNATGTAVISATTMSGNAARTSVGGAILTYQSTLTLTNVTIDGNTAPISGAALRNDGGSLWLRYVTLSDNVVAAASPAAALENAASGATHLYMTDTLIANNAPRNCQGQAFDSVTFSLTTDNTCFPGGGGNLPVTAQALTPLAYNGGFTLTRLPVPGSAAVEAGTCLLVTVVDQRHLARPSGPFCDMGATERQAVDFGWYMFLPSALRD